MKREKKINKKEIEEAKKYIKKVISEIPTFIPFIQTYQIKWEEDNVNSSNGEFSIVYEPENFNAEFHIYKDIFEQIPDEGLTEGFKNYIKIGLSHEVGHCYIWELEGTKRDTEKVASLIGFLIATILDNRKI